MKRFFRRHHAGFGVVWVILLFLTSFSYAMFQGGFVSWFVFYSFVPIMIYTLAVAFYPLNDIKIERVIEKTELLANEPLKVTVDISRRLRFPLFYIVIEDEPPENMLKKHRKFKKENTKGLFTLGIQDWTEYSYTIKGMPRGEYRFRNIKVKTGDIFGFIQKEKTFNIEQTVLVYPRVSPMRKWAPLDLSYGGQHRSKKHFEHDLTSISSIRDYIPGDRLSWLDWKATARTNNLVTKQFEFPLNNDVVVVLDRTENPNDEDGERFDESVSLAASLTDRALQSGASVGFISMGKQTTWVDLTDQSYHKWVILHHLALAEQDGAVDTSLAFNKYLRQLSHQTNVVFVTTRISDKMVLLFNDLLSRGLALEFFYLNENKIDAKTESTLSRLRSLGVYTHNIKGGRFDDIMKAGDSLATS